MSKFLNNMTVDGDLSVTGGISSGTVTAQQFSYLSGATSNIQQQITNLTNNTTGKLLSSKEDIVACTDPSYFASATAVKEINNNLELLSLNNAASHNAFYVEKDITDYYQDGSLWDRIAGTNGYDAFEGIFPGCTFLMNNKVVVSGYSAELGDIHKKILLLGCNYLTKQGATQITYNHLLCCPYYHFGKNVMNDTATTAGGYVASKMYTTYIGSPAVSGNPNGTINEQLYNEFGSHLLTFKENLTNNINTTCDNRIHFEKGASSGSGWYDVQATILSEVECYGTVAYSGSGFDVASTKLGYPAFSLNVRNLNIGNGYWLRDIAGITRYANCDVYGCLTNTPADNTGKVIRARFALA